METKSHHSEFPKFTLAWRKSETGKGYFGLIRELPGVASQGKTKNELKKNIMDAIFSFLESNRLEMDSKIDNEYEEEELEFA